jgi:predicted GNAT family acetyltransferase
LNTAENGFPMGGHFNLHAMEISHEEKKKKGSFFVEDGSKRTAEIQYFHSGEGEMTIYHTEVDPSLRGQGVGEKLVASAVAYAREKGLKIDATCPFAHKVIGEDPETRDILV